MIPHDAPSDYLHCFNASKCGYDCVTELVILCQELLGCSMTNREQWILIVDWQIEIIYLIR